MNINNPPPPGVEITNGAYTGDATVNRGIPHGLGRVPKIVFLTWDGQAWEFIIQAAFVTALTDAAVSTQAVTTPDATNFYVGNAASHMEAANQNLAGYHWFALG